MTKLFASDSEIWDKIYTSLEESHLTTKAVDAMIIINRANDTLEGLPEPQAPIKKLELDKINTLSIAKGILKGYVKTIHERIEAAIDEPFRDGIVKLYAETTMVNPREATAKSDSFGGAHIPVLDLFMPVTNIDPALQAAFEQRLSLVEHIRPSKDLKQLINSALDELMQQYAGVTDASTIPKEDVRLLVHYYQLQYP